MKKILSVVALVAAALGTAVAPAAADSGPRQDDFAPHSNGPVSQLIGTNGDVNVSDLVDVTVPVNVPVAGSKTGPQQIGNEHSSGQLDAPLQQANSLHKHVVQGLPL